MSGPTLALNALWRRFFFVHFFTGTVCVALAASADAFSEAFENGERKAFRKEAGGKDCRRRRRLWWALTGLCFSDILLLWASSAYTLMLVVASFVSSLPLGTAAVSESAERFFAYARFWTLVFLDALIDAQAAVCHVRKHALHSPPFLCAPCIWPPCLAAHVVTCCRDVKARSAGGLFTEPSLALPSFVQRGRVGCASLPEKGGLEISLPV